VLLQARKKAKSNNFYCNFSAVASNFDLAAGALGMRAFGESLSYKKAPQRISIRIVEKVAILQYKMALFHHF